MKALVIEEVDPSEDGAFDAWYDVYRACVDHDRGPDADPWSRSETSAELRQQTEDVVRRIWSATAGGDVVGAASLALPMAHNRHRAAVQVFVHPAHRREGIGRALHQVVEAEAVAAGRTTLAADIWWPWSLGRRGVGSPGVSFARAEGYELAIADVRRVLALPVDDVLLDRLAAEAAERHAGYDVWSWVGPVPDDVAEGWVRLESSLETEAPTGELDIDAPPPEVSRLREQERLLADQGRTSFGTVATTATGEVVAYNQIVVSGDDGKAYQWGTLVRADHRGCRLGLAVKVATLRLLQQTRTDVPSVSTYNASVNTHMVAINEALGFRPVEWLGEFQKKR